MMAYRRFGNLLKMKEARLKRHRFQVGSIHIGTVFFRRLRCQSAGSGRQRKAPLRFQM
jgi:hypothetical protein